MLLIELYTTLIFLSIVSLEIRMNNNNNVKLMKKLFGISFDLVYAFQDRYNIYCPSRMQA
jgi:hypothetical protein